MNSDIVRLEKTIDLAVKARVFGSRKQAVDFLIETLQRLERDLINRQMQDLDA
ncbi:MAG: hypothetical protein R3F41_06800 [Gammaproteobacteria bacterium]|nr:hypothetical protein [Pseudomonadales bacterium]MCP5348624.1 hypothetical protein [Pseudomonadales bacterium]